MHNYDRDQRRVCRGDSVLCIFGSLKIRILG